MGNDDQREILERLAALERMLRSRRGDRDSRHEGRERHHRDRRHRHDRHDDHGHDHHHHDHDHHDCGGNDHDHHDCGGRDQDRGGNRDEKRIIDTIVHLVTEQMGRMMQDRQAHSHERGGGGDEKRIVDLIVSLVSEHVREIVVEELVLCRITIAGRYRTRMPAARRRRQKS
jgi:hypothetical protein